MDDLHEREIGVDPVDAYEVEAVGPRHVSLDLKVIHTDANLVLGFRVHR